MFLASAILGFWVLKDLKNKLLWFLIYLRLVCYYDLFGIQITSSKETSHCNSVWILDITVHCVVSLIIRWQITRDFRFLIIEVTWMTATLPKPRHMKIEVLAALGACLLLLRHCKRLCFCNDYLVLNTKLKSLQTNLLVKWCL